VSSPKIEVFFVYDDTSAPLTGLTPTFDVYKDDLGADLLRPTITEIGTSGAYKFTPDITSIPGRGIAYVVNCGSGAWPMRLARYIRPEDFAVDMIQDIHDESFGKWKIFTSGPDINRLVIYKADGVTVLKKFDLLSQAGFPTTTNPFSKVPV
jgi:hypothetical protein